MNDNSESRGADLGERAALLLKLVVERYIVDGQPVGSKTLAGEGDLALSPATIRNVLADLERMGFLHAPHTSAGRVPTASGYRYFVDSLLTPETLDSRQRNAIQNQLNAARDKRPADAASNLLSRLTHMAAVVTIPSEARARLQRIEFLPLSDRRVLAILVVNGSEVQNRVLDLDQPMSRSQLVEAANFLNARFAGRTLNEIREGLVKEVLASRKRMNAIMRRAAEMAQCVMQARESEDYVLSGGSNLFDFEDSFSVETLKSLFEAFDRKRDLLALIERCVANSGIQIFIGQESGYAVLDNCSLVTAPYRVNGETAGVVGVIGPTRMAYQQIIPLVSITAGALGTALNPES